MAAKRKVDFTPRTDEQENMSGFFPPPPTISMAEKVGFLIVPKLTSIEIGALGAAQDSVCTQAKFLPYGRRVRAVEAYEHFTRTYGRYLDAVDKEGKCISPYDNQLGRDSAWVQKAVDYLKISLDMECDDDVYGAGKDDSLFAGDLNKVCSPSPVPLSTHHSLCVACSATSQAVDRVNHFLHQVGVDTDSMKCDGVFSFHDFDHGLLDISQKHTLRVWRLYYALAKVYLELEVLNILLKGAFLLCPPRCTFSTSVYTALPGEEDESPLVPKRLLN